MQAGALAICSMQARRGAANAMRARAVLVYGACAGAGCNIRQCGCLGAQKCSAGVYARLIHRTLGGLPVSGPGGREYKLERI